MKKMPKKRTMNVVFDESKKYSISFNCMRNGMKTPISYALGCVYALYDLAETKLEVYHTHLDSYNEIIKDFKEKTKNQKKTKSEKKKALMEARRDPFKRDEKKRLEEERRRKKMATSEHSELMEIGQ